MSDDRELGTTCGYDSDTQTLFVHVIGVSPAEAEAIGMALRDPLHALIQKHVAYGEAMIIDPDPLLGGGNSH